MSRGGKWPGHRDDDDSIGQTSVPRLALPKESDIQATVARYLDATTHVWCHVANERRTTAGQGAQLKRMGVKAGVPDVLIFDLSLAIELKTAAGRVSPSQKLWHDRLRACGWRVEVCRSAQEAIELVREVECG